MTDILVLSPEALMVSKLSKSWFRKASPAFTTNPLLKLLDDLLGTYA
jgi:hypothetical protein